MIVFLVTTDHKHPDKKKSGCVFDEGFMFKRGRCMEDLKLLPQGEYINPAAPLVRAGAGARALSKAQNSKQWHTGVEFWDGIRSSVPTF